MAGSKQKLPKELPVSGIYKYFKALEKAKTLEAFLADCDADKHTLGVSNKLFILGHRHFANASKSSASKSKTSKSKTSKSKASKSKAAPKTARKGALKTEAVAGGVVSKAVGTDCPACPKPPRL